jgi:hypothetical protein
MTGTHLHLLVNHAPILGAVFALALLVASPSLAPDVLRRTALVVIVGVGIAGAAANYSSEPAEDAIRGFPGVHRALIHDHEEMGEKSFYAAAALGVVALAALARWRRVPVPRGVTLGVLFGAAVVSGMMAYTGLPGGRVRHTEVRPDATAVDAMTVEPLRAHPGTAPPAMP